MVRVIPKEEVKEKESLFIIIIYWFSFLFLIVAAGLTFFMDWKLKTAGELLVQTDSQIAQADTKEQKDFKDQIYGYKRKIDDVSVILKIHKEPTKIFNILEDTILPDVTLDTISYQSGGQEMLSVAGQAKDIVKLAQQILLFEKHPGVDKVALSNINVSSSEQTKFTLSITLKPAALTMQ